MTGWILAPPPFPVGRPGSRTAAKHVSAHDHRANVLEHLLHDRRARVDLTALLAMCLLPGRELDRPGVQRLAANTERILQALVRPGDVTVERHSDRDSRFAHWSLVGRNLVWRRTRPAEIDTRMGGPSPRTKCIYERGLT